MKEAIITQKSAEKSSFGHRPMSQRKRTGANSEPAWEKKRMYRIKKKVFPPSLLAKGLKNLQWQRMGEVWTPHYPGATAETDGGGPNTTLPRSYSWKTFSCVCACGCVCVYMSVNLCRCHTPLLPSVARCLWESSDRPLSLLKQSNLITIFGVQGVYLAEI